MLKKSIAFGVVFLALLTSGKVSAQVIVPGPPPPRPVVVVQAPPRPRTTVIVPAPAPPVKVVKVKRNKGHHYGKHHKRKVVVIHK